jgi:hypothetical protein
VTNAECHHETRNHMLRRVNFKVLSKQLDTTVVKKVPLNDNFHDAFAFDG